MEQRVNHMSLSYPLRTNHPVRYRRYHWLLLAIRMESSHSIIIHKLNEKNINLTQEDWFLGLGKPTLWAVTGLKSNARR